MQLLTVDQVAAALQIHKQTVRKMIKQGVIPSTRIGRAVRVDEGELVAFVRTGSAARSVTTPLGMISVGQLKALHAKADRADRMTGLPRLTAKRRALAEASVHFSAQITSASHLDELQAIWVLERIDELAELVG